MPTFVNLNMPAGEGRLVSGSTFNLKIEVADSHIITLRTEGKTLLRQLLFLF